MQLTFVNKRSFSRVNNENKFKSSKFGKTMKRHAEKKSVLTIENFGHYKLFATVWWLLGEVVHIYKSGVLKHFQHRHLPASENKIATTEKEATRTPLPFKRSNTLDAFFACTNYGALARSALPALWERERETETDKRLSRQKAVRNSYGCWCEFNEIWCNICVIWAFADMAFLMSFSE